jgi:hypothetical protein
MHIAKTISIRLPPDLLLKAQKTAEREDPDWDALLRRTQATGKTLGIATGADVKRLSDEFRRTRRQSAAR